MANFNPFLGQQGTPTPIQKGFNPFLGTQPISKKPDLTTPEGLRRLAEEKGIEVPEKTLKESLLGGIGKITDILRTGEFAIGGLLAGEGVFEGVRKKISPSDVLFGEERPEGALERFALGTAKLATDIFLDPTTYLTLGAGSALKIVTKAGTKIAISKSGKELVKELAEEIATKSKISPTQAAKFAKEKVGKLVSPEATTLLERGGLVNIRKGLEKAGLPATRENVELAMREGIEGLRAKRGLKFAGREIISAEKLKAPFIKTTEFITENLKKTEAGRDLIRGVENVGSAIGKTFNRDFGLPALFVAQKQKFIDSFDNAVSRVKNEIGTIFSGTTKAEREAISLAIEGGEEAIQQLAPNLRPLVQRVKHIFESIAKEEEKRGLLNNTLEDYVTHIYKNRERAETILKAFREGQPSALLRFGKNRSIPSITEAERLGLEPIKDIAEILNIRLVASEKAKLTQDFYAKVALKVGIPGIIQKTKQIIIPTKIKEIVKTLRTPIITKRLPQRIVDLLPPTLITQDTTSVSVIDDAIKILENESNEIKRFISESFDRDITKVEGQLKAATKKANIKQLQNQLTKIRFEKKAQTVEKEISNALNELKKFRKSGEKELEEIRGMVKTQITKIEIIPGQEIIKQVKKQNPELARRILEQGENFTRLGDVGTGIPIQFRDFALPATIANDIVKMGQKFFTDESTNTFLRMFDRAQNFFKGSVTVLFPSFHGRNAVSNTLLNFMDIGVQAFNPARWKQAVDIMLGQEGKFITELGEEFTYGQVRKLMKEHQVFQERLLRTDVGRMLKPGIQREGIFGVGRRVGRAIENEGRLINFLTNLRRGFDPTDAAERTKRFLFDYDNLSAFEKEAMRRAIPFYTFTRKNLALQMRALVTDPKAIINPLRAFQAMSESMAIKMTEEEKEFAPEYVRQGLRILLDRKGDDRTFLIGFDLPMEDAFEKLNQPIKSALSMLSPFLKAPLEIATGKNFFREKDIKEDDSGKFAENYPQGVQEWLEFTERTGKTKEGREFKFSKVNPEKKWILQNVSAMTGIGRLSGARNLNQLNTFWRVLKGEKITLEERFDMVSFFTGIRAITVSLEAEKRQQEKKEAREIQDILERKGEIATFERPFIPKD